MALLASQSHSKLHQSLSSTAVKFVIYIWCLIITSHFAKILCNSNTNNNLTNWNHIQILICCLSVIVKIPCEEHFQFSFKFISKTRYQAKRFFLKKNLFSCLLSFDQIKTCHCFLSYCGGRAWNNDLKSAGHGFCICKFVYVCKCVWVCVSSFCVCCYCPIEGVRFGLLSSECKTDKVNFKDGMSFLPLNPLNALTQPIT